MTVELFANNYTTTLNGAVTSTATTVVVASAVPTNLRTAGQWRLLVESEILLVTAVNADNVTLTVTRGAEGTAAAAHASGASAAHIVTAGGLNNISAGSAPTILEGLFANRPAAGTAGRIYLATDADVLSEDNGTAWALFGPLFQVTPPVTGNFTWQNQGTASISSAKGAVLLNNSASGSASAGMSVATPATPYTVTLGFLPTMNYANEVHAGLFLQAASNGNIISYGIGNRPSTSPYVTFMTGYVLNNTFGYLSTIFGNNGIGVFGPIVWMQIVDDGTTRYYKYSVDGANFITVYSEPNTTGITAARIGFYAQQQTFMNIFHWAGA